MEWGVDLTQKEKDREVLTKEVLRHPVPRLQECRNSHQRVMEEMHRNGGCTLLVGDQDTIQVRGVSRFTEREMLSDPESVRCVARMIWHPTGYLQLDLGVWFTKISHAQHFRGTELRTQDAPFVGESEGGLSRIEKRA